MALLVSTSLGSPMYGFLFLQMLATGAEGTWQEGMRRLAGDGFFWLDFVVVIASWVNLGLDRCAHALNPKPLNPQP